MSRDTIRARVAAATEGPWWLEEGHEHRSSAMLFTPCIHDGKHGEYGDGVADLWDYENRPLIAHARQDIPALLKALDAAERSLDHAEHYECDFAWCEEFRAALDALEALP